MFKTLIILCAILVHANGGAMATDDTGDSKIFPYRYEMRDLKNGLRVIVLPTDYPNIVSLQIPVQTGSRNEIEPGKSGFAHFFEHMMFRGTKKYPADEYNQILKNAGADQNAYTTDDYTNYHITFSKEDLPQVLELEADRFMNLEYSVSDFKTEAKAVLGEYNKNSTNPYRKLLEVQRNSAFKKHTYKHTTMGFIADIQDMPNQYEYSRKFFKRYYTPEKTIIILAGDLDKDKTFKLVEKYWGNWKAGDYEAPIPTEPEPSAPIYDHVEWGKRTLPWVNVAFHGPSFSDTKNDMAAMDVISKIAFSRSSDLYQRLVVKEQKVDQLFPYFPDRRDPHLLTVSARIKKVDDVWYVRDAILEEFAKMRTKDVPAKKLNSIKSNMKYGFAHGMDNSAAIASTIASYVEMTRDPESINRLYNLYDAITPEDIRAHANRYFTDKRLVVTTLSHEKLPSVASMSGSVDTFVKAATTATPDIASVIQQNSSPLINLRFLFNTGAAADPTGKAGLAQLTAEMITNGGSTSMKYEEIQKALYPMAASFNNQVDKEMTVFQATTHVDNLAACYEIVSQQLLAPAWDETDFNRVKTNLINKIKVNIRQNNDEELGKEALYEFIYEGHSYGHLNLGHVNTVEKLTLDDVRQFYQTHYTQTNLVLGLAGGFDESFLSDVKRSMGRLPAGQAQKLALTEPAKIDGFKAQIIQKETRAVAISFGFPIDLNRNHPDFAALWLARSYLGEHRSSNGKLYQRIRKVRGMNYGDYAYIEYFPRGMFQFHPDPNLGRQQQIFQIWIRPVESNENAHFATRVAMYELKKLINEGLSKSDFEATRNYLLKFVNILTKTQDRQLGYAMDSRYYALDEFTSDMAAKLEKLKVEDVNRIIKKHLQSEDIKFVFITNDAQDLKERLVENKASKLQYQSEKPAALYEEDKIIYNYKLRFKPENVAIKKVEDVFMN